MLYRSTDRLCRRGAPMQNLAHSASFESLDKDAPSKAGTKQLGHRLLWRSHEAAGFALPETDAELVVHLHLGPETDILVDDVDEAFASFLSAGGEALQPPFDIAIGRCARIRDPFGNELVILDQSKGRLVTDSDGRVTGVEPRDH